MTDRPRALAVLIAVFLVGAIAGASGSYFWLKQKTEAPGNHRRQDGPPDIQGRQKWMNLLRSLQLTPEQDARFKEIMMESWKEMEPLRKQGEPLRRQMDAMRAEQMRKIEAIRIETNNKISAILSPEQRKKFEEFLKEAEDMGRHMSRGRKMEPPPPDGPPPGHPGRPD
ncbi:MAG: periplasmic heavy metal sensor [Acidobacteria bacterium]|nr:periplasmic heavy metal sensor [Acidobacteriota bacterium]